MTRVGLDDFNEIPALPEVAGMPAVRFVTFDEFISTEEPTADAILGSSEETLLPVGGVLLMYGDGGAGKTTLTIDAVVHLASGVPWLGIEVERPVVSGLIENEGPRGKFRRKLDEKFASWNGHPEFSPNVHVLEEPWTRFSLREEAHRVALAGAVSTLQLDLVVMGPLVTLGMIGGGTPDEVGEFEELIRVTRALVERPFALWIVHHENKAGDVSGAWERVPDCLVHVQAQGNGHTRVVWRKARWADEAHGTHLDLTWADGRSFTVKAPTARDLHAEVRELFADSDGWRTTREVAHELSANEAKVRDVLRALVQLEELEYAEGPPGRNARAKCYRLTGGEPSLLAHLSSSGSSAPQREVSGGDEPTEPPLDREGRFVAQLTHPLRGAPGDEPALDLDDTTEPSF